MDSYPEEHCGKQDLTQAHIPQSLHSGHSNPGKEGHDLWQPHFLQGPLLRNSPQAPDPGTTLHMVYSMATDIPTFLT